MLSLQGLYQELGKEIPHGMLQRLSAAQAIVSMHVVHFFYLFGSIVRICLPKTNFGIVRQLYAHVVTMEPNCNFMVFRMATHNATVRK
jgi:hypothetical protein